MEEYVTDELYKRALELQAKGPDEFPFGYYLYLAEEERNEIHPS